MCPRGRPRGQGRPRGLHLCFRPVSNTTVFKQTNIERVVLKRFNTYLKLH